MNVELVPNKVHNVVSFGAATQKHLNGHGPKDFHSFSTVGNCFNDGLSAWLHSERSLEVISTCTGWRNAVWEFGHDVPELPIVVTCVTELKHENGWFLIVGTDNGSSGGFVYVFDVKKSKVTKVISIPHGVTVLEVVSTAEGEVIRSNWMLSKELRMFFGIVVVGTQSGLIYLVDLMLDESNFYFDEINYGRLVIVGDKTARDIPSAREACFQQREFLAYALNDGCLRRDQFYYQSPENGVELMIDSDTASVTSLLYIHQLGFLAVGYTFGGFQLYNLGNLALEHTFVPEEENCLAVTDFAFMEPDNDPRNYCYLWVIHGRLMTDYRSNDVTVANLYSLAFMQKNFVAGLGYCYKEMTMCSKRFNLPLVLDPSYSSVEGCVAGSSLNCCRTIDLAFVSHSQTENQSGGSSSHDDGGKSLCFFVWEVYFKDMSTKPKTVFAIFDINQWYQAQMPSRFRTQSTSLCSYVGFFSVDGLCNNMFPSNFLTLCVPNGRISHSHSVSPTEIVSYPSSLVFDVILLFDTRVVRASFVGIQGQVIRDLNRVGSSCLVNPQKMFSILSLCHFSPIYGEPNIAALSANSQREMILSVALEQNLVGFLLKCVNDLASGKNVTDACNLRFFQEWAWKRVSFIKTFVDRQCVVLYDYSGLQLDSSLVNLLHARVVQLKLLKLVYGSLLDQSVVTTDQGVRELQSKINVIHLLALHLDVVLWFLNVGLLPESIEDEELADESLVYLKSVLTERYSSRRVETQAINSSIGPTDLLLIDGLISDIGEPITSLWEKDGGSGLYPPPNFHSLLNLYLLNGVPDPTKHRIVQYLFLDLAYLFNDGPAAHVVGHLVKYPATFSLSPSLIKLTQGFWLLDHRDFEEALYVLLHPIIKSTDITVWQHRRIMKAFLYQGEPQKALRYDRVRQPNMETPEDRKFHLTLLIANGLINEAFSYQKTIRTEANTGDVLHHFFLGCQQTNNFRTLLQLPFSTFEEEFLKNFMMTNPDKKCRELLVIHFLRWSRYIEAKQLNDQLKSLIALETNPAAIERANTRNSLVEAFYNNLPPIKRTIFENARSVFAPGKVICQYVKNPQPLSTVVNDNTAEVTTQSTLICNVLEKVNEIWNKPSKEYDSPIKFEKPRGELNIQSVPFLCNHNFQPNHAEEKLSAVIYPTVVASTISNPLLIEQGSPSKKTRYLDVSPMRHSESTKRSNVKHYNSEVLSLLQTPPVRRKTPKFRLAAAVESATTTPPSILKGRTASNTPVLTPTSVKFPSVEEKSASPVRTSSETDGHETPPEDDFDDAVMTEPIRQLRFEAGINSDDSTVSYPLSDYQVESATEGHPLVSYSCEVISDRSASNDVDQSNSPLLSETPKGLRFSETLREADQFLQEERKPEPESIDDNHADMFEIDVESECTVGLSSAENSSDETSPLVSASSSPYLATDPFPFDHDNDNSSDLDVDIDDSSTSKDVQLQTSHKQVTDILKEENAEFRSPSVSGHRFAMSPGTILQKMLEVRSRMMADKAELDDEAEVGGSSALKSLVDSTIESFLSEPIAVDGPKFVSGAYPCDFPSRRLPLSFKTPTKSVEVEKTSPRTRSQAKKELEVNDAEKSPKSNKSTPTKTSSPKAKSVDGQSSDIADETKESSPKKQSPKGKSKKSSIADQNQKSPVSSSTSEVMPGSEIRPEIKRLTRSRASMSPAVFISSSHNLRPRRYSTSTTSSSGKPPKANVKESSGSEIAESDYDTLASTSSSNTPKSSLKKHEKVQEKAASTVKLAKEMDSNSGGDSNDKKSVKSSNVFSFSKPMILAEAESITNSPTTPVQSFIFSPPFTRSKSRKVHTNEDVKETDLPASRPPRQRHGSASMGTPHRSETPINFISPIIDEEGEISEPQNVSSRRQSVRQSGVSLRKNVMASRRSTRFN